MTRNRRRIALLLATALAHAGLLAWLNLQTPRVPPIGEGPGVIVGLFGPAALGTDPRSAELADAATELAAASENELAVAEPIEMEPLDATLPTDVRPMPVDATAVGVRLDADPVAIGPAATAATASAGAAAGGGDATACRLAERLQDAMQGDATVLSAVARIAPQSRSVANAVMIWNGRWTELGGDANAPIRAALTGYVRAAPGPCREEAVSGPLFLYIAGEPRTTILAVGSGVWRWSDLLRDAERR